jgi:arylsulfatase A-like enzyme
VLAVAASGSSALAAGAPAVAPGLNVVVIETDDQTAQSLWAMPTVDRLLARKGVSFDNSFVSYSLCCPSRATFLTGQYAHNHGVVDNTLPYGGYEKLRGDNTLPVWLREAGYRTILVGKYLNRYGRRDPTEVPPGWTDWHGLIDPTASHYYGFTINDNGHPHTYGPKPSNYQTDVLTGKAVRLIRSASRGQAPFFMWTTYFAPHYTNARRGAHDPGDPRIPTPVPARQDRGRFARAPLPFTESFDESDVSDKPAKVRRYPRLTKAQRTAIRRNYRRELETLQAVDRGVGRIVAALRETGELDHTVVAFTSDNGYFHGEHRIPFGKRLPYEPSIRVPLVIRGPGVRRDVRVADLVSNQDLAPTILDAANAEPGLPQDGLSLLPLMGGGELADRDLLIEGRYPFGHPPRFAGIRTTRWFYGEYTTGERELYDLSADPDELTNRSSAPGYEAVEADLANRLAALRDCSGETCRTREPPAGAVARER